MNALTAQRRQAAPEIGAEVTFQRTPTHHPETGVVCGRQFGTGIIEVVDMNAKPLRLDPSQYQLPCQPRSARGRQSPPGFSSPAPGGDPDERLFQHHFGSIS